MKVIGNWNIFPIRPVSTRLEFKIKSYNNKTEKVFGQQSRSGYATNSFKSSFGKVIVRISKTIQIRIVGVSIIFLKINQIILFRLLKQKL